MTPKEKARYIVERYHDEFGMLWYTSKKCALITVDEILKVNSLKPIVFEHQLSNLNTGYYEYWEQVKNEISNL